MGIIIPQTGSLSERLYFQLSAKWSDYSVCVAIFEILQGLIKCCGTLAQMPPNQISPICGCDDSLDIVVIPVVLVLPEFLLIPTQRLSEYGRI